jgi:hypothetical protein
MFAVLFVAALDVAGASRGQDVQDRIDAELELGRPIVIHVVVALCDNEYQGIVPVPKAIGNGQDPKSNLYWGAAFGVKTFLPKRAGWSLVSHGPGAGPVLERIVLKKEIVRGKRTVPVFLVADAWDGRTIRDAIVRFLGMAAGRDAEAIAVDGMPEALHAGGNAHLVAFVGHDGLMDFSLASSPAARAKAPPRSSIVLACASQAYFSPHLARGGSHPLLLTTNLMAPEAYTLDAAVTSFAKGESPAAVVEAAASAYSKYQKCSMKAARGLFTGTP